MKNFNFFTVCIFAVFVSIYAAESVNAGCLEKEKALALLETAESLLTKAKVSFPSCEGNANSTSESDCNRSKSLAYMEIAKILILDVRRNFPTCPKPIEKDDNNVTKPVDKEYEIVKYLKPKDCSEILANGHKESRVYTIWPSQTNAAGKPLQVYCDMETDNGGWTVIQRRGKFPVQQDFYLDWEDYKNGFGNIKEEFWLGNENIRVLCQKGCEIRFDLKDAKGKQGFAHYQNFTLSEDNYILNIKSYTGNVGDSMKQINGYVFSTKNKEKTEKAKEFKGGWWYNRNGNYCNLNGIYQPGNSNSEAIYWFSWRAYERLAVVEMKVKSRKS